MDWYPQAPLTAFQGCRRRLKQKTTTHLFEEYPLLVIFVNIECFYVSLCWQYKLYVKLALHRESLWHHPPEPTPLRLAWPLLMEILSNRTLTPSAPFTGAAQGWRSLLRVCFDGCPGGASWIWVSLFGQAPLALAWLMFWFWTHA